MRPCASRWPRPCPARPPMRRQRAARGAARVDARRQDLALALELLHLARGQHAAGASPAIDTTRASTQVVASRSALLVAGNEVDRARLDLARAVGLDPARPPLP